MPVKVIAYYTKDGVPKPLRFAVQNNEEEEVIIKNIKVNSIEQIKIRGERVYKYVCQSIIRDQLRLFEMRFYVNQCVWHLFKI